MANVGGYNRKLAALLKKHGLVPDDKLKTLGEKAAKESLLIATLVVQENLVDEMTLLGLVSEDGQLSPIDLDKMKVDIDGLTEQNKGNLPVTEEIAKYHCIMPLAMVGDYLTIAVANPYDVIMLDDLKINIGKQLLPVVSTERAILKAIEYSYHAKEKAVDELMNNLGTEGDDLDVKEADRVTDDKEDADLGATGEYPRPLS